MTLQDGINQNSQRPNAEWGLACQVRPERCISFSSHPTFMPEVPQIQIGRPNLAVQSASIRSEQCSMCVHQANKAGDLHIKEVGDQINPVPRRYDDW